MTTPTTDARPLPLTAEEEAELRDLLGQADRGDLVPTTFARCIALGDRKRAAGAPS